MAGDALYRSSSGARCTAEEYSGGSATMQLGAKRLTKPSSSDRHASRERAVERQGLGRYRDKAVALGPSYLHLVRCGASIRSVSRNARLLRLPSCVGKLRA